jgi:hypothetical protein
MVLRIDRDDVGAVVDVGERRARTTRPSQSPVCRNELCQVMCCCAAIEAGYDWSARPFGNSHMALIGCGPESACHGRASGLNFYATANAMRAM